MKKSLKILIILDFLIKFRVQMCIKFPDPQSKNLDKQINNNVFFSNSSNNVQQASDNIEHTLCCEGYTKKDGQCLPECRKECKKGICTAPNICSCLEGYIKEDNYTCIPKCDNCDDNSYCLEPNVCKCFTDYIKHENGSCLPDCIQECGNGYCSAPDTCSCHKGYTLVEHEVFDIELCAPICSKNCTNGYCLEPEICACNAGYAMNAFGSCVLPIELSNITEKTVNNSFEVTTVKHEQITSTKTTAVNLDKQSQTETIKINLYLTTESSLKSINVKHAEKCSGNKSCIGNEKLELISSNTHNSRILLTAIFVIIAIVLTLFGYLIQKRTKFLEKCKKTNFNSTEELNLV